MDSTNGQVPDRYEWRVYRKSEDTRAERAIAWRADDTDAAAAARRMVVEYRANGYERIELWLVIAGRWERMEIG